MYALVTGVAFFSGVVGTAFGALLRKYGLLFGEQAMHRLCRITGITASGFHTAVACFVLLPEAFLIQGVSETLLWTVAGLLIALLLQQARWHVGMCRLSVSVFFGMALAAALRRDGAAAWSLPLSILLSFAWHRLRERELSLGAVLFYSLLTAAGGLCGFLLIQWESRAVAPIYSLCSGVFWFFCADGWFGKQKRS